MNVQLIQIMNGKCRGKVGGDILGVPKSLPLKWTKYIDWIEIVRTKGILLLQP